MKLLKNDISYILAVFYYQQCRIFISVDVISFGNWFMVVYFHSPIFFIAVGHMTKHMMFIVRHSNIICPSVKMSTLGLCPCVDILTSGHIILECRTDHHASFV